jgi:hypothetical protein
MWHLVFDIASKKIKAGIMSNNRKMIDLDFTQNIVVFGLSLSLVALALLSIYLFGEQHFGISKWLTLMMLPVSLSLTLFVFKKIGNIWIWVRWLFCGIFFVYAIFIIISAISKQQLYDEFTLGMILISVLAFAPSLARVRSVQSKIFGRNTIAYFSIGLSVIFLVLSWCTVFDLTNWYTFKQVMSNNFGVSIVGAFLVMRVIFYVLFELKNFDESLCKKLSIRKKKKNLYSPLYLDGVVIMIFFWISFRYDSLFLPGSEYHWEYFVGVVRGIQNGGWLLWDTPSQYGFLNVLLASIVPSSSAWQSFYVFQGILLFIVATGIYFAVRRYTPMSVVNQFFAFAILFMGLFFADPELIGPYPFPSSSVVRFFCVYALVLATLFVPKIGIRQALLLSIIWSISIIWSAESAVYGTSIFMFILLVLLKILPVEGNRFRFVGMYTIISFACLIFVFTTLYAIYFTRLGVAPDLFAYFDHAVGYATGFGYLPFPLDGPGNLLLIVFLGILLLCVSAVRKVQDSSTSLAIPFAAMAGCIWGVSTYYIGRPAPQNITAILPIIVMSVYFCVVLARRENIEGYALPIKAAALPLFFIILIPLFTPNWIEKMFHVKSFSSDITSKLPKATFKLNELLSRIKTSSASSIVYYGDDAAPPIFSGDNAKFNERIWLPTPLQLLEIPVSDERRRIYLHRYICRNQKDGGILINRIGGGIEKRLQGFIRDLNQFYDIEEIVSNKVYKLYSFSDLKRQHCIGEVGKAGS